jgi:hypothetical protein
VGGRVGYEMGIMSDRVSDTALTRPIVIMQVVVCRLGDSDLKSPTHLRPTNALAFRER